MLYEKSVSDCVFLDFSMEDMTGIEFLEILKKRDIKVLPTVFISDFLNPILIDRAIELGVKGHMGKENMNDIDICHVIKASIVPALEPVS